MPSHCLRAALTAALAVPLAAQESAAPFDAAQVQIGPLEPAFEAIFDLDGDAHPDVVGALFGTSSAEIGVYRNDGNGRFLPAWRGTVASWFGAHVILPGDFDGDGRRDDFAVSVGNALQIHCFDGVGAPTFIGALLTPPQSQFYDAEVFDFDHDGRDDLIVLAGDNGAPLPRTVTVHLSAATRGQPPVTHTLALATFGTRLRTVRRADGAHVAMLFTNGIQQLRPVLIAADGQTITAEAPIAMGAGLYDPAAGDIDGDGDEDLVLFGMPAGHGQYQVLRQANLAFTGEAVRNGGPATGFADVDGDGDLDGICCGGGGGGSPPLPNHRVSNFEIAIQNAQGEFEPSFHLPGLGAAHIAGAVDVDADGDVDLVAGRVVHFARGPLTRSPLGGFDAPPWFGAEGDLAGPRDGDGDGDLDLGISPYGGHRNVGLPRLVNTPFTAPVGMEFVRGMNVGDFDADGDVDALIHVEAFGSPPVAPGVWLARQTAPGRFDLVGIAMPTATDRLLPSYSTRAYDDDLDRDGIPDLVLTSDTSLGTSYGSDIASIYRGHANGSFSFVGNLAVTVKAVADFSGDGRPELLVARNGTQWAIASNLGGMSFATPQVLLATQVDSQHDRPAVGDLDGDGDLDCALAERGGTSGTNSTLVVFLNDGSGALTAMPRSPAFPDFGGTGQRIVRFTDVDGDRDLDILAYPGRGTQIGTTLILQQADRSFREGATMVVAPDLLGDLDGDGANDLIALGGRSIVFSRAVPAAERGAFEQRGTGGPGTGGSALLLGARGPFRVGEEIALRLRGGRGGAVGGLVLGLAGAEVQNAFGPGQHLYLDVLAPTLAVPIALDGTPGASGEGTLSIPVLLPPSLFGAELHHQAAILDPAAPLGVATSNGLRLRYGS